MENDIHSAGGRLMLCTFDERLSLADSSTKPCRLSPLKSISPSIPSRSLSPDAAMALSPPDILDGAPIIDSRTCRGSGTSGVGSFRNSCLRAEPFAVLRVPERLVVEAAGVETRESDDNLGVSPGRGGGVGAVPRLGIGEFVLEIGDCWFGRRSSHILEVAQRRS